MKRIITLLLLALATATVSAQESAFDTFLTSFNYDTRADMKIDSKELVNLMTSGKAVLVDIRFPEEVAAWHMAHSLNIPLNELPKRLAELPKDKIIVTACPHKDRSTIAMAYLRSRGYRAKYLNDGLLGLAEYLRGERAGDFMEDMGGSGNTASAPTHAEGH
jgi:rhodanese-related sulfurtransferase